MNSFVVKSGLAAALMIAPLVAEPVKSSGVFPAPISLMNLSPSFAAHPNDLTLLAPRAVRVEGPVQGTLSLKRSEATPPRQPSPITQENAANFHFDARLPASPTQLVAPQAGRVFFKVNSVNSDWTFRKTN
jgi:hypothetical protein